MGRLIEIFNCTCPASSKSCMTCSCKFCFTNSYIYFLRSQLLYVGLVSEAALAISHGLYLSVSSKYFFPEISFGSRTNQSTVSSSVVLHLAQPQWSLWPAEQSKEQMHICLSLPILCSVQRCVPTWLHPLSLPGSFFGGWFVDMDRQFQHGHTRWRYAELQVSLKLSGANMIRSGS